MNFSVITIARWLVMAALSLVMCNVLALWHLAAMKDIASRARNDLVIAKKLSEFMSNLDSSIPNKKAEDSTLEQSITRIREGLEQSRIPESAIADIRIQGRTPISKTQFVREDTRISLTAVDMKRLFDFILAEESHASGTICSSIDIRYKQPPKGQQSLSIWDAQLTLTHLVETRLNLKSN